MTGEITILIAFSAGILSFFSPCILPLIPAYLSFISGSTFSPDENASAASLIKVAASTLLFVLGFTIIFTALGASASLLGGFIGANKLLLSRVGGAIIIFMGLVLAGLIKIPALHAERRLRLSNRPFGMLGAVPIGMVFGLGWTPCVGPVLSSILVLAAGQENASSGGLLLGSYSIGMGIPFVASGLLFTKALTLIKWVKTHYSIINAVSSGILIFIGITLVTGQWQALGAWIQRLLV